MRSVLARALLDQLRKLGLDVPDIDNRRSVIGMVTGRLERVSMQVPACSLAAAQPPTARERLRSRAIFYGRGKAKSPLNRIERALHNN